MKTERIKENRKLGNKKARSEKEKKKIKSVGRNKWLMTGRKKDGTRTMTEDIWKNEKKGKTGRYTERKKTESSNM